MTVSCERQGFVEGIEGRRLRIILLGPPGVGKGTVAGMLEAESGAVHLSTGDMLREEVSRGTEMGVKAAAYMNAGGLVPDELVISVLKERVAGEGSQKGFILDGFPRNIKQAEALEKILSALDMAPDTAVNLEASEEVIVQRLSGRMQCGACSRIFHLKNMPPRAQGVCDNCGGTLFQRPDDRAETVKVRLKTYAEQTAPLIEFYSARGILKNVNAGAGPSETFEEVKKSIRNHEEQ